MKIGQGIWTKAKKVFQDESRLVKNYQPTNISKDFMPFLGLDWHIINIFFLSKEDGA